MTHYQKPGKTVAHLCAFILLLAAFLIWKGVAVSYANGCGAPQFGGNQTNVGVGIGPKSIATGDFNHDGRNDLAVANYGSGLGAPDGGLTVLLNNGAGGFLAPNNIPAGINPRSIITADFNNDGHLELAVLHYSSGSCCINGFATILLGDGTGKFTSAISPVSVGFNPGSLAVGDFNKDGKSDLVATLGNSKVSVLLGNGTGGFGTASTFAASGNPTSIAAGDLNADGKPDLVTGNLNGFSISVLLGDGLGGFSAPVTYSTSSNPQFVALGDVNQDSKLDVVTATTSNTVAVLLGNGTGSFGSPAFFTVASSPDTVLVRDLNGDGRLDLATANSGTGNISILIGDGSGGFGSLKSYSAGSGPFFVTSSEINGDGKPDLLVANISSNNVSILTGDGAGGFGGARTFNVGLTPLSVAGGDFNADGKIDLAVPNSGQNSVSILLGEGSGSFAAEVKYPAGSSPKQAVVGDYNADGKLDLAVANNTCCQTPQSVSILLGDGKGGFGAPTTFSAGTGAYAIVSADFNNDGKADLAVANNADNNISLLLGNGNGTFAAPVNFTLPASSPSDLAYGDVNGDGNTDVLVAAGNIFVLLGNGAGSFSVGSPIFMPGAVAVAVGDINGDGKADLATANSTGSLSVLLGNGLGSFGSPDSLPVTSPNDVAFGDFNGDGKLDLAATNSSTTITILPGDGAGAFGTATPFNSGSSPIGILAIDINGDGRLDIATANFGGNVSVLLNTCLAAPLAPPVIAINNPSLLEGHSGQTNAPFTVTLSKASAQTVTVGYYTISQSAANGTDYQTVSGRITFSPGTTSQIISVPVLGDTNIEPNETFLLRLRDGLNANILVGQGKGTILNDDEPLSLLLEELGPTPTQAAAIDSVLMLRDPFPVINGLNLLAKGTDRNTRVAVFVMNLRLAQGETSSSVIVNLIGNNNQSYNIAAEDVRLIPNLNLTQVVFRLPNNILPGTFTIKVKAHGQESNSGTIRIRS
ncbi:MAG TPA: FG-GAP-like repeat-containing protein [Pyrinomonadaceae bacterium]|jgi:hypothetical protein